MESLERYPPQYLNGAWYLRGFEKLMEDMLINKDYAHKLMDMVMKYSVVAGFKND